LTCGARVRPGLQALRLEYPGGQRRITAFFAARSTCCNHREPSKPPRYRPRLQTGFPRPPGAALQDIFCLPDCPGDPTCALQDGARPRAPLPRNIAGAAERPANCHVSSLQDSIARFDALPAGGRSVDAPPKHNRSLIVQPLATCGDMEGPSSARLCQCRRHFSAPDTRLKAAPVILSCSSNWE